MKNVVDLHNGGVGKVFKIKKCKYCNDILESNSLSAIHNFTSQYDEGKAQSAEEKSIVKEGIGSISLFKISFDRHANEHNTFNSDFIIENFLKNVTSGLFLKKC